MKTKIYILSLFGSLLFTMVSCLSDGKEEFLDEYESFVYLLNSGEQEVTWYKTGKKIDYNITVDKAGNNLDRSASAELKVLSQSEIDVYNQDNETSYKALPANCYELPADMSVAFSEKELYQIRTFVFDPDKIYNTTNGSQDEYVVMVQLTNATSPITESKKYQIIKPTVLMPTFSLEETGLIQPFTITASQKDYEYSFPIELTAALLEDLTFKVEVDAQLIEGQDYTLVPANKYSIGDAVIPAGETKTNVVVKIDIRDLNGECALPLKITTDECGYSGDNTMIIAFNTMPKIILREDMLTLTGTDIMDGTLADWIDGETGTQAQVTYGSTSLDYPFPHYLDVALDESVSYLKVKYVNQSKNNQAVKAFSIKVSNDGEDWKEIEKFIESDGLPYGSLGVFETSTMELGGTYKYVRYEVTGSYNPNSYPTWGFSEFELYGR
ncbi:DUF1735 domain-containing protein [uncultured Bacteroides sp.]|uniref:BT_3987 domain-containing protein n=1 Tax=uncultured Bacteroides sp. TaxID=162156 RepID=UPI002600771C|nr:DUF1735 domain-containing protein [uncultured Bacteroides sp.]